MHVEDRASQLGEADLRDGGEVLEEPLDGECERSQGQQQREVATSLRQRQEACEGEPERDEPPRAERAEAAQQQVERIGVGLHPCVHGRHDVGHQPLFGPGVGGRALQRDEPEEARKRNEGQEKCRGRAGNGTAETVLSVVADDQAAGRVRQSAHAA